MDYSPLDRCFHSPWASTEDNEVKKQIRVGVVIDEETKVYSYQLHNRRYLNAKLPILHKGFSHKREQTGDEAAVSEAEVDAQMGNAPRLPELTVSLDNFRKLQLGSGSASC